MADRTSTAQSGRRPAGRPGAGAPPVVDPPDAGALLAAIEVVASFVSTCEAARYDGDDAASLVAAFSRGKRLCAAGETLVAARAAECHAHLSLGHRSPADWLAAVTGASVGEAADVLKVGEALPSQPGVEAALRGGKLTPSRAKLVTGAVRRNPQKEAELVRGAEADTFRQLKDRCLRARAEGPPGRGRRRRPRRRARRPAVPHLDRRGGGLPPRRPPHPRGRRLPPGLADPPVRPLLPGLPHGRGPRAKRGLCGRRPGGPGHRARPPGPASPAPGAGPMGGQTPKRGGAGIRRAAIPRAGCRGGAVGRPTEPRAMVQVRVDLAALRRGSVANGETCEIPGVGPVSVGRPPS